MMSNQSRGSTIKKGDTVKIEIDVSPVERVRMIARGRQGGGRQKALRRGRVVWVGPQFVTVEFPQGYRESFGLDEIRN